MTEAAAQLAQAIREQRRIVIFGDYDVDGLTATAIMILFLREFACNAEAVIPHRLDEGYGLTEAALQRVCELAPELVVTVDCGVSSAAEVELLASRGIATIITDHHEPSGNLPGKALAVTNPKLDANSQYGILAGAGVALKLTQATGRLLGKPDLWLQYTDLATLGTIADVMPLLNCNRALVQEGLLRFVRNPRPGIQALNNYSGEQHSLKSEDLSFGLIPRLNAAGRMDDPALALELLLCSNPLEAKILAERLDSLNTLRRQTEQELTQEAMLQAQSLPAGARVLIAAGRGWHDGVRGIVASRLARNCGLPTIVFSVEGQLATGSGRSVGDINLFAAVQSCANMLERFGGHAGAVGVTVASEKLPQFTQQLNNYIAALPPEQFLTPLNIDAQIRPEELTLTAVQELQMLEPLGHGNPQPCLMLGNVQAISARRVGEKANHLSFTITAKADAAAAGSKELQLNAIWFNCPPPEDPIAQAIEVNGNPIDLACTLQIDEWRGRSTVKLRVQAVRLCTSSIQSFASQFITRSLGAKASLHQAQAQTLDNLAAGQSTLAIMATGRGKSLIFQIMAAWLADKTVATKAGQPTRGTVIVYPLCALLNDQYFHLCQALEPLGLSVQRLCGQTARAERAAILAGYREGRVQVLLTTPEYLAFNRSDFAGETNTGLLVFDEAHHIATSSSTHRPVYARAGELAELFSQATILALSATAGDKHAGLICSELGIKTLVRDNSTRENLQLVDRRNLNERTAYLASQINASKRSIVYVNSRATTMQLTKDLRKLLPEMGERIVFYHAGLTREDRLRVEAAFRQGDATTIVATSAFGEGVNIASIRDVFLYHLPFAAVDLNQLSGRAGRDGLPAFVHLLYGLDDVDINRGILEAVGQTAQDQEAQAEALQQQQVFESFKDWALGSEALRIQQMIQGPILPKSAS
jgi:single-stranded-DNA-specific exonuclease